MRHLPLCLLAPALLLLAGFAPDAGGYKLPPKDIVALIDAPRTPASVPSPARDAMLVLESEGYPRIARLAEPVVKLAGAHINPSTGARQHNVRYTGISVQRFGAEPRRVSLPPRARIGSPSWSPDGRRFAFTRELADGIELWIGDAATATAKPLAGLRVTDVLGGTHVWLADSRRLVVRALPAGPRQPAPPRPRAPAGPVIDETAGKQSQMPTFQELLRNSDDERLFEHYGRSRLVLVDIVAGSSTTLGEAGLLAGFAPSPDDRYLLVTRVSRPFSYRVPWGYFPRRQEVWDLRAQGRRIATVAELPLADEVPRQGVTTGARAMHWQPLHPARLLWREALDGGDPVRKVPHRDRVLAVDAPFTEPPREVLKVKGRLSGFDWLGTADRALVTETDRDRRWTTTRLVDLGRPDDGRVIFDRSYNDTYGDPGRPVYETRADGTSLVAQDGDAIFLAGQGQSEAGARPFLDRLDLARGDKKRLWQSDTDALETFLSFAAGGRSAILIRRESPTEPPNLHIRTLGGGDMRRLTAYPHPAPQLQRMKKELIRYKREDGVPLSGTLYLPADHTPGKPLPALVWAYPLEYSDADTAGQVRGSLNRFTLPRGDSPLMLVTQGYAVLMDATMPVVGGPEVMNNTFVEQISAGAKAAVDKLVAMGVAERGKILVGGHSYGAFMTANLLAHTDLFVAGIARSGAYNRTLTPFGFQAERRSYWEATELYTRMSPFTYAHRINEPVLLIHGEADINTGTFPIQSERLFQAIRGNGGTARYVVLPHEGHGYQARESVLHVIAEMLEWADRWTGRKGGQAPAQR